LYRDTIITSSCLVYFYIFGRVGLIKYNMAISSNYLHATLMATLRRSPFKFANTKVPHADLGDSVSPTKKNPEEEVPSDPVNIQLRGKNSYTILK